eukprot:4678625-Prymnesium_polylepis.1
MAAAWPPLPTTVLIGLAKAGTTELHSCLTSTAFVALPAVCCRRDKELRIFSFRDGGPPRQHLLDIKGVVPEYERLTREHGNRTLLLDFTPLYITTVLYSQSAADMMAASYRTAAAIGRIHLVLLVRDPVQRALTHYCMFAAGADQIRQALRTSSFAGPPCDAPVVRNESELPAQTQQRLCLGWVNETAASKRLALARPTLKPRVVASTRCPNATGWGCVCSAVGSGPATCNEQQSDDAFSRLRDEQLDAIGALSAQSVVPDTGRSRVVHRAKLRNATEADSATMEALYRILWPSAATVCESHRRRAYGWEQSNQSFAQLITSQLSPGPRHRGKIACDRPPGAWKGMATRALREYTTACFNQPSHLNYAVNSVPVFHLALYLRVLGGARWSFLRFEALEALGARNHTSLARRLGQIFGLRAAATVPPHRCFGPKAESRRSGGLGVLGRVEQTEAERVFAPWVEAMEGIMRERVAVDGAAAHLL